MGKRAVEAEAEAEAEGGGQGETDSKTDSKGPVWVVGVEDFMRRFLPGKSNTRSIFALAQLNGIVKYACQKVLHDRSKE